MATKKNDKPENKNRFLPKKKTKPNTAISDLSVLIYGPSKIGKSTWCSHAENAIFIATEPGLNQLEVYQTPVASWPQFLDVCGEIARGEHPFKTVIIDTIDNLYKACEFYVCKQLEIKHPSDLGYGKGYQFIRDEFSRVLIKLALLPYGLILVSHSTERDKETKSGKHTRTVPTVPESVRKFLVGLVDLILFCDIERINDPQGGGHSSRVVKTKPHPDYDAGDRTGLLPETLPLDFAAFAAALQGSQPKPAPENDENDQADFWNE